MVIRKGIQNMKRKKAAKIDLETTKVLSHHTKISLEILKVIRKVILNMRIKTDILNMVIRTDTEPKIKKVNIKLKKKSLMIIQKLNQVILVVVHQVLGLGNKT